MAGVKKKVSDPRIPRENSWTDLEVRKDVFAEYNFRHSNAA